MSSKLLAGRYELLEKIGDGGMAVVYKAKDKLLNRYIAIKVLRPEFTKDATFVENFKRESQAAAGLSHPNIVGVYDVGREGNINYIVMELVNGRTLNEIIAERAPMDYRTVIDISKQVASALKVAHKNKIIHRDVKPHNIMITPEGTVKLADFGIAKAVNDATLSTGSKVIGSVHYFSPEQARGNYVDERSDIYSLGIVMYEMLTGRVPFDGENPVTIALRHINEEIVPPSEYVSGIPPALERAVLKATSKFQTNRFNSADELIEELDNIEFVTKVVGNSIFNEASDVVEKSRIESTTGGETPKDNSEADKAAKKKKRIIIAVVVALLILIPVGVFAGKYFLTGETVEAPDLYDLSMEQAEQKANELGIKVKKGKEIYSSEIAEGRIVKQDPKSGEEIKKGSTITVTISKGSKDGTVPNIVGMNYEEADTYLKENGYALGVVKEKSDTAAAGTILEQDPAAGTSADKETKVNVVVSDGKGVEPGTVPSVTGLTLSDAKAAIEKAGFKVGNVTYEESNAYGKDYVMWQQYAANTSLDKGTTIDIEVSKGAPAPTEETEGTGGTGGGTEGSQTVTQGN